MVKVSTFSHRESPTLFNKPQPLTGTARVAFFCLFACVITVIADAHAAQAVNQHQEIRARQKLGRVLASPDGRFIYYEWLRPYDWVRARHSLSSKAFSRMRAWLYRVDTQTTLRSERIVSRYLFAPEPSSSYWLGSLSPDADKISFYELNNDRGRMRTGIWSISQKKFTWFDEPPDDARLERAPQWVSNSDILYLTKARGVVRGNVATGRTYSCAECVWKEHDLDARRPIVSDRDSTDDISKYSIMGLRLRARSETGGLLVLEKDTSDVLGLFFVKAAGQPIAIFENRRR